MPAVINFDPHTELMVVTFSGRVTGSEINEFVAAILDSDAWDPACDALCDGREVLSLVLSTEDVKEAERLMAENAERLGTGRTAVVVPAHVHFGSMNLVGIKQERLTSRALRVFEEMQAALEWLGRLPAQAQDDVRHQQGGEVAVHAASR